MFLCLDAFKSNIVIVLSLIVMNEYIFIRKIISFIENKALAIWAQTYEKLYFEFLYLNNGRYMIIYNEKQINVMILIVLKLYFFVLLDHIYIIGESWLPLMTQKTFDIHRIETKWTNILFCHITFSA